MARYLGKGNGKDGVIALGSYTPLKYTCSGTTGVTSLTATGTFSAGNRLFIIQSRGTGVGAYEDNQVASYTTGTITLVHPLENDYTDLGDSQAQVLIVPEASSVTGTLTLPAWDGDIGGGFVIACSGLYEGVIIGTGKGFRGGIGAAVRYRTGEGSVGASLAALIANGNGGGGGNYDASGPPGGGGGSNGTVGTIGGLGTHQAQTPGAYGLLIGSETLEDIFMGGGGGSGGSPNTDAWYPGGNGGPGGGFVVIYADSIANSASVTLNGSDGLKGVNAGGGSGAGGGGGSCLVKCTKNLGLDFTATGGIGAPINTETTGPDYGGKGGDGGKGRLRIETCTNTTGTEDPTASTSIGGHDYCGIMGGII